MGLKILDRMNVRIYMGPTYAERFNELILGRNYDT